MGNRNLLFESIFNRKFSDEDIRNFLEQVTKEHPYFSPAQYFLLLQADKESTAYAQQVAKTSVLFNNPHWLKFQLDEYDRNPAELSNSIVTHNNEVVLAESTAKTYPEFEAPAETTNENELSAINSFEQEAAFQEPEDLVIIYQATEPAIEVASTPNELEEIAVKEIEHDVKEVEIEQIVEEVSMPAEDSLVNDEVKEVEIEQIVEEVSMPAEDSLVNDEVKEVEIEQIVEEASIPAEDSLVNNEVKEVEIEQIVEDASIPAEDSLVNDENKSQNEVNEVEIEQIVEKELIHEEDIPVNEENEAQNEVKEIEIEQLVEEAQMDTEDSPVNEENEAQMEGDEIVYRETAPEIKTTVHSGHFNDADSPLVNEAETEEDISSDKEEMAPLNFRLNIDTSSTTEDTISFEPLHATDYFASLGIKLSGEIQPTDKLGKQLKSFTEWLKTMKKIHSDQQARQNGQAEITVQKLAENSNKQQEVVTESMADVLLQQGKAKKAIEVYKKLSLLDSSKSAYFAAKIDQLKEH